MSSPIMTSPILTRTRLLVKKILEQSNSYLWSLQGLGMLRLYLSEDIRLHVWDNRYCVPNVSEIHDHPWDFESEVIAGAITNSIFEFTPAPKKVWLGKTSEGPHLNYMRQTLMCGTGGGLVGKPELGWLQLKNQEVIESGWTYQQKAEEIHQSRPVQGTVSIITRTFRGDKEHAHVFWKKDNSWVSAEPRKATDKEVHEITQTALKRLEFM